MTAIEKRLQRKKNLIKTKKILKKNLQSYFLLGLSIL